MHRPAGDPALGGRLVRVNDDSIARLHNLPQTGHAGLRVTEPHGDLRYPHQIMTTIAIHDGVDLGEPVAIIAAAILHHLDDTTATRLLAALREHVVTGSYLLLTHPSAPYPMAPELETALRHYQSTTNTTWALRDLDAAPGLLGNAWTPQPPGITPVGRWHPTPQPGKQTGADHDTEPNPLRAAAGWAVLATATPTPDLSNTPAERTPA